MMEKLRMSRIRAWSHSTQSTPPGVSCGGGDCIRPAAPLRSCAPQQPDKLLRIEPVAADDTAVEQQHRHVEPVAARQLRVAVDIEHLDGWQLDLAAERGELREHLLAQLALLAVHDRDSCGHEAGASERLGAKRVTVRRDSTRAAPSARSPS